MVAAINSLYSFVQTGTFFCIFYLAVFLICKLGSTLDCYGTCTTNMKLLKNLTVQIQLNEIFHFNGYKWCTSSTPLLHVVLSDQNYQQQQNGNHIFVPLATLRSYVIAKSKCLKKISIQQHMVIIGAQSQETFCPSPVLGLCTEHCAVLVWA